MVFNAAALTEINMDADNIKLTTPPFVGGLIYKGTMKFNSNYMHFGLPGNPILGTHTFFTNELRVQGDALGVGAANGKIVANSAHICNSITSGSVASPLPKAFIHPHPTEHAKLIRYVALESAEALTIARGTARTENGQATIILPEHFAMVTSETGPITVILTPKGAPAMLYTQQESREKIVVAMKSSDFAEFKDVDFSYQVTGVRDGFEDMEIIIAEEKLDSIPDYEKNDVMKRIKGFWDRAAERRELEHSEWETGMLEHQGEVQNVTTAPIINKSITNNQAPPPAPTKTLTAEFTAGPNPADRREGGVVSFYYQGKPIKSGQATIYGASGNVIKKIKLGGEAQGDQSKHQVGSWNLTDKKGRLVPEGTYLVKGTVTATDGKKSAVSVMVGVR